MINMKNAAFCLQVEVYRSVHVHERGVCTHLSAWKVEGGEAQVRLIGHQVGPLHLQDGFVFGQRRQVFVTHHLVVQPGLCSRARARIHTQHTQHTHTSHGFLLILEAEMLQFFGEILLFYVSV